MSTYNPVPPTQNDISIAKRSVSRLAAHARQTKNLKLHIDEDEQDILELPAGAVALLLDILGEMAKGNSVTLIPQNAELTTQEAANLLGVSRPFVVELIKKGELPSRQVGRYRRLRFTDVMHYKDAAYDRSEAAMDELVDQAEKMDMGY